MFALAFTHTGLKIRSQPKAGKILYNLSFARQTSLKPERGGIMVKGASISHQKSFYWCVIPVTFQPNSKVRTASFLPPPLNLRSSGIARIFPQGNIVLIIKIDHSQGNVWEDGPRNIGVFSILTMNGSVTQISYPLFRILHRPHIRSFQHGLLLLWKSRVVGYYVICSQTGRIACCCPSTHFEGTQCSHTQLVLNKTQHHPSLTCSKVKLCRKQHFLLSF